MTVTKDIEVTITVRVSVDETKFTPEFMRDFRETFYPFHSLDDHIQHLAQMEAREMISGPTDFVEGYGQLDEMGITTRWIDTETEEAL